MLQYEAVVIGEPEYIGLAGVQIITRIFGLVICSVTVSGIVIAIKLSFGLH